MDAVDHGHPSIVFVLLQHSADPEGEYTVKGT
jgi:hypothetical protein